MFLSLLKSTTGYMRPVWNVSAHVGFNGTNYEDDSQLVALGFHCMGLPGAKIRDPENRAIYAAVPVGPKCTGRADDPIVVAIRAFQKSRGGTQDGVVSTMKEEGGYTDATGARRASMILVLNNNIFDTLPDGGLYWPRIDRMEKCPPAVRNHVLGACTLAASPGS